MASSSETLRQLVTSALLSNCDLILNDGYGRRSAAALSGQAAGRPKQVFGRLPREVRNTKLTSHSTRQLLNEGFAILCDHCHRPTHIWNSRMGMSQTGVNG